MPAYRFDKPARRRADWLTRALKTSAWPYMVSRDSIFGAQRRKQAGTGHECVRMRIEGGRGERVGLFCRGSCTEPALSENEAIAGVLVPNPPYRKMKPSQRAGAITRPGSGRSQTIPGHKSQSHHLETKNRGQRGAWKRAYYSPWPQNFMMCEYGCAVPRTHFPRRDGHDTWSGPQGCPKGSILGPGVAR